MIGFRIEEAGRPDKSVVVVGVDRRNVDRLTAGKPLRIRGKQLGLGADVVVGYADRLEDFVEDLARQGLDVPAAALDAAREVDERAAAGERDSG